MVLIGAYVLLSHVEDTSAVVPPIGGAHTIADSINKGTSSNYTGNPPLSYEALGMLSASASLQTSYKWTSSQDYPDGTFVEYASSAFNLKHIEFDNTTLLAKDIQDDDGNLLPFTDWSISKDLSMLLLTLNYEGGWRHSFFADYWIYDLKTKVGKPLNQSVSDKSIPHEKGSGKISLCMWSPHGHNLAWVRDNDLFVTLEGKKEIRITNDGSKNIINGLADWVYEEEVLAEPTATWFSIDGKSVAFVKFDDTLVKDYELQYYAKYGENQYPTTIDVKYPKPGTPNPIVTLHIASLSADGQSMPQVVIDFGKNDFEPSDKLFTQVTWIDSNSLFVRMMNRVQDRQKLFLVSRSSDFSSWSVEMVRDEVTPDEGWFPKLQPLRVTHFKKNNVPATPSYIELMDINDDGFMHMAYFEDIRAKKPTRWITNGHFEVTFIKGINEDDGVIYYLSTENGSTERHVYSIHLDGTNKKLLLGSAERPKPVIGQLPGSFGLRDTAGYYDAAFSPKCSYYVLGYLGPDIPWERIEKTGKDDNSFHERTTKPWNYAKLYFEKYALPNIKYFTIKNNNNDDINVKMVVPFDFDPSGRTKYPVLMHVYGGPDSQLASQQYQIDFMYRIAARKMISVIVDGRGTGFKGRKFRASVTKNLGKYEVQDQVTAAKYFATQPFVDSKRIGIWGWSYGGYMASKCIEADAGVFALGMAVAPVTDWRYYDTVYTERFMKTPAMNPEGYSTSAVMKMEGFKHSKFLIVHGTADDNVHFQNSADLVWHLTGAHVKGYDVQYYTDSDHSMGANGASIEVYDKLQTFMCDAFAMKCVD